MTIDALRTSAVNLVVRVRRDVKLFGRMAGIANLVTTGFQLHRMRLMAIDTRHPPLHTFCFARTSRTRNLLVLSAVNIITFGVYRGRNVGLQERLAMKIIIGKT
jgi:hypothetical protein